MQALEAIDKAIATTEREHARLDRELAALRATRKHLIGQLGGEPAPTARRQRVAQHHLDAVRQYVEAQGRVRQADIGRELDINSGLVSTALRLLEEEGAAVPGAKEYGSTVWEWSGAKPAARGGRGRVSSR